MTKYRLKKDLPDLEAGEIFDATDNLDDETSSMFDSRGAYRFEKDDIKHFDEWFEEVADCKTFCDSVEKCVVASKASFMSAVSVRFPKGCQKQRDRFFSFIEAVRIVSQDDGFMKRQANGWSFGVVESGLGLAKAYASRVDNSGRFYFDSGEHAQASIDKHPDEWREILTYDWSKE